MSILSISSGNAAINFIYKRIKYDSYRGAHHSQHNRYDFEQIKKILTLLDKHTPNGSLLKIRTTDISKRPQNTPDEYKYAAMCDEAKVSCNIGTQDAMRKNIFVDLHRMGLIHRYNKNSQKVAPFERSTISFVSLSELGRSLISSTDILKSYFCFSKAIDQLLNGVINTLLAILREEDLNIANIDIHEYMFFISAIELDDTYPFGITRTEALELITSYRSLSRTQRAAIIQTLKTELVPSNYSGNKLNQRDFHNWINEAQQVYSLLNQTVYFEVREDKLVLKTGRDSVFESENKLNRSLTEKFEYFRNHEVSKTLGFELHHVVPLAWSENVQHFKLLDKWNNMVYIDAFSHAKITQNNNKNVLMSFDQYDMKLNDYNGNEVYLSDKTHIMYAHKHKQNLLDYNNQLRTIDI